ncbi:MAG: energy transducer TonB, partial [Acidobacteriota bacterium]
PPVLTDNDLNPPEYFTIGDITGSIGGARAVYLAKPTFPNEAKEAGAEGKVKVEIEIDEEGGVTSAKAVSGDQLFYGTAQNAALKSKFLTPKTNGQREKIAGYLNYNFTIETPNWFKVGYDLAMVEKVQSLYFLQTAIIKKAVSSDWQTENDLILKLDEIRRANPNKNLPILVVDKVDGFSNRNRSVQQVQGRLIIPQQNYEQVSISQRLVSALRGRLGNDEKSLWQFNLGVAFVEFQETFRNPKIRRESFEILRRFVQNAPAEIQPAYLEQLQNLASLAEQKISDKDSDKDRIEIGKTIANLQKIK